MVIGYPETELVEQRENEIRASMRRAALTLAGATALGGTIWMLGRRKAA
jgi:hypothetical protein